MIEILSSLDQWLRSYLSDVSMALVASLLVIYGNDINNAIRALVKRYHFIVRTGFFVFVCAFGYGLLTVWLTPVVAKLFAKLTLYWLTPVLLSCFILLGMLAQRQRHI